MSFHNVVINGKQMVAEVRRYIKPNNIAIIIKEEDGAQYTVASVNPQCELRKDAVALKLYGEHQGLDLDAALQDAGIIGEVVAVVVSGFATIPVYELLVPA